MPLKPNAVMVFTEYAVQDAGIRFRFVCADPGGGEPSDYWVLCTDAELAAVSTQAQLRTLLANKLNRAFRASAFAAQLDPFIGQSITI